jgi:hypothetical protein
MTELKFVTDSDYRALDRESFSSIKYLLESPAIYWHYKEKPWKGSPAALLGTCVHHYLQGNKNLVEFNYLSRIKKNEEEILRQEQEFIAKVGSEGIIAPGSFKEKLDRIEENFLANKMAVSLLQECEFEKAFLFELNGVPMKGKLDGLKSNPDIETVEIKTSSQATDVSLFREEAYEANYDMQAYLYLTASGAKKHTFIIVNTREPYRIMVHPSSAKFIESGRKKALLATERYKKHILGKEEWSNEVVEEV